MKHEQRVARCCRCSSEMLERLKARAGRGVSQNEVLTLLVEEYLKDPVVLDPLETKPLRMPLDTVFSYALPSNDMEAIKTFSETHGLPMSLVLRMAIYRGVYDER